MAPIIALHPLSSAFKVTEFHWVTRGPDTPFTITKTFVLEGSGLSRRPSQTLPQAINAQHWDDVAAVQQVATKLRLWLRSHPACHHPRSRDALLSHLQLLGRVKIFANADSVFRELSRGRYLVTSNRKKRAATADSPPPGKGKGKGKGEALGKGKGKGKGKGPAGKGKGGPTPDDVDIVPYVKPAKPSGAASEIGGQPNVVLGALQPRTYEDLLRKAKAWAVRLADAETAPRPKESFMRCLTQVCTASVRVDPEQVLDYLVDNGIMAVTKDGIDVCAAWNPQRA